MDLEAVPQLWVPPTRDMIEQNSAQLTNIAGKNCRVTKRVAFLSLLALRAIHFDRFYLQSSGIKVTMFVIYLHKI